MLLLSALTLWAVLSGDTNRAKTDSLPLVSTRTIEFETSEGTWLSLDVSPDGRTIAFELLGDIYTLPIGGGRATPITSGPAFDSQPRWSPDGRRLAFLSDRDGAEYVWTIDPDGGKVKQVSRGDKNQYVFQRIADGARKIVEAGGHVGLGGHGQLDGLGDHWELWTIASGGLKPLDVLRVGTLFGAQAIGLDQDLGSLEAGKLADLLVLDGNPLEDIHNTNTIRYVMKNGRLCDGDTLDEIAPRARRLEPQWWWNRDAGDVGPAPPSQGDLLEWW